MSETKGPLDPGLYIVSTPIGNLGDITLRALAVLRGVDAIAAEDTRVTRRLLAHYGITTPLVSYHEHNAGNMRPRLLERLAARERIALVSDAGTPLIADPGFKLVEAVAAAGIAIFSVPGPSALAAALSVAGLPTDRVLFAGFLPTRAAARRKVIAELATVPASLVVYETPHRLKKSLADLAAGLGDRPAALCRELTKLHEEVRRDRLPALAAAAAAGDITLRGECVLVIGPPPERHRVSADDVEAALRS
ncbi:MAG: 16S rRNA (cytidine(1402)-2'-O)-methyltransferase, partial [Rhodothalassiaceae bacterium]